MPVALRGSRGRLPLSKMFWLPKRNLALPYTPQRVTPIITQSSRIENRHYECAAFIKSSKQKPPTQWVLGGLHDGYALAKTIIYKLLIKQDYYWKWDFYYNAPPSGAKIFLPKKKEGGVVILVMIKLAIAHTNFTKNIYCRFTTRIPRFNIIDSLYEFILLYFS